MSTVRSPRTSSFSLHISLFGRPFGCWSLPWPKALVIGGWRRSKGKRIKLVRKEKKKSRRTDHHLPRSSFDADDSFIWKNTKERKKNRGGITTHHPRGKREKKRELWNVSKSNDKNVPHRLRVRPRAFSVSPCAHRRRTEPSRRRRGRMISSWFSMRKRKMTMNDWKKSTLPSRWGWTFQRGVRNHFLRARRARRKKKKPCYVQTHERKGVLHAAAVVQLFSVRLLLLLSTLSCEDGFFVVFFPRNGLRHV